MPRKYNHQGYQNTSSREEPRSNSGSQPYKNLTTEERIQRNSLRRATERTANEVMRCQACGTSVQNFGTIVPDSCCPRCQTPMHCCRSCRNFDTAARWQCRAEIPRAVEGKSAANDCEQYAPRLVLDSTGRRGGGSAPSRGGSSSGGNDAKSQFENLFKR